MSESAEGNVGKKSYVLVTAAWNEEAYIREPLRSVVAQILPPRKWVIVSDASTDGTDEIVREYAKRYPFIQLYRMPERHKRNWAAQVDSINAGCEQLRGLPFDFVGNLDADISLEPDYFERLIGRFEQDPRLGLAGGSIYEEHGGKFEPRLLNRVTSVAHGVQFFRRDCFQAFGGYLPLPYGGPDWHAEVTARMNGWAVRSFPDLHVFHHRPSGTAEGRLRSWYRQGLMDYSLGSHPAFEIAKISVRLRGRPPVVGALVRLSAFTIASIRRMPRPVSNQFIRFLRAEQMARLLPFGGGRLRRAAHNLATDGEGTQERSNLLRTNKFAAETGTEKELKV